MFSFFKKKKLIELPPRDSDGVVLGGFGAELVVDTSMDPVAVVGACRSGKGISSVIPTLLTWQGSAIVIDKGGELHPITEKWRRDSAGNKTFVFDLSDENSRNYILFQNIVSGEAQADAILRKR